MILKRNGGESADMTPAEFYSCSLLALGIPLIMFMITVGYNPRCFAVMIYSTIIWGLYYIISLLVQHMLGYPAFWMVLVILLQELIRYVIYLELPTKAQSTHQMIGLNRMQLTYAAGLSFGFLSGIFPQVDALLGDSFSSRTLGFAVMSSAMTLCIILLHTFWNIILFYGLDQGKYDRVLFVFVSHIFVSYLRSRNWNIDSENPKDEMYISNIIVSYLVLIYTVSLAFECAGGSFNNFMLKLTQRA